MPDVAVAAPAILIRLIQTLAAPRDSDATESSKNGAMTAGRMATLTKIESNTSVGYT